MLRPSKHEVASPSKPTRTNGSSWRQRAEPSPDPRGILSGGEELGAKSQPPPGTVTIAARYRLNTDDNPHDLS
jgi:hypothetical protein